MALVAPDIVRYSIVGSLNGQDCISIMDARITGPFIETRNDAIARIAGDLLNQWTDHILPLLSNNYTFTQVRWVDLDSAAGGTGAVSETDGVTLPATGGLIFDPLPNNVYAKIVKNLEGKTREQRNGALRLGGLVEGDTDPDSPNTVIGTKRTALNDAFENLKDGINEGAFDFGVNLVVVHTENAAYNGYSEIATFNCAPVVGTIRRRMPGYGS